MAITNYTLEEYLSAQNIPAYYTMKPNRIMTRISDQPVRYISTDVISEETAGDAMVSIESAGNAAVQEIEEAGAEEATQIRAIGASYDVILQAARSAFTQLRQYFEDQGMPTASSILNNALTYLNENTVPYSDIQNRLGDDA